MVVKLRLAWIAIGLALVTLAIMPAQLAALAIGSPLAARLPVWWHRAACALVGIRVRVRGTPARQRPLLIASNHVSWSDIVVLGSVMPLSFIAKSEVRDWPVFGWLARLQRTIFVERARRGRTGEQADAIARRMAAGDAVVLFAEGTTFDGNDVLPFKPALFGAAQACLANSPSEVVMVQPIAIAYLAQEGVALGRTGRSALAWIGDTDLVPHLVRVLGAGALDVEIRFGSPIAFDAASSRKTVCGEAHGAVRHLLGQSILGRP